MGRFVIRPTATGVKFDLVAGNGEVVATSEVYRTESACRAGIASVMRCASAAAVEDQTAADFVRQKNPKFELYRDRAGAYRFRLKAANGRIIAVSEGYRTRAGCEGGIAAVKANAAGKADS